METLVWPAKAFASGVIIVRIPFLIEITEGFAGKCHVFVGGSRGGTIVAKVPLAEAGRYVITMRTPAPVTPKALGTAPDERPLGLAMPVGPEG